eukprot:CAMPEP_0175052382 /NCGR_PEP_ID=MMETSP0052_2-20121109/8331_1 /TAXON_ID=51329 ORGANISM="Polytomella parva, Strain SAG 63-3" /NCGR_SAMPLE_ID=MMETSP0052_2 /ASSEMBLY_ACC=CAM_ASM_000194 /LENGTH=486 /DNA_ID=CAMNT_0016316785 /DNA_START=459 /DNA_END=1919 /DNA_ORIENTATION=-
MLVFAEHRYYGQSRPFAPWPKSGLKPYQLDYLSTEQAMFDYVELVDEIKKEFRAEQAAVIAFGGSYGGMLAAWMRMKYPHVIDGAIAASAPIWNFFGETPTYDTGSFAQGVTYDASMEAGSSRNCVYNVRAFWSTLSRLAQTPEGCALINQNLNLCPDSTVSSPSDAEAVRDWIADAWDNMAMGNFPYASGYILNGDGQLPPFPIHEACRSMATDVPSDMDLLQGMAGAIGVYYNHSHLTPCFDYKAGVNDETDAVDMLWDFQWCSELFMPSSTDGVNDMFWPAPFDAAAAAADCRASWQVSPRPLHAQREWGGRRIEAASNIVFTNGLLDPWHGGGVLTVPVGASGLMSLIIPEGAHHLDLMFSNPEDPISVVEVRKMQMSLIKQWVAQVAQRYANVTLEEGQAKASEGENRERGKTGRGKREGEEEGKEEGVESEWVKGKDVEEKNGEEERRNNKGLVLGMEKGKDSSSNKNYDGVVIRRMMMV